MYDDTTSNVPDDSGNDTGLFDRSTSKDYEMNAIVKSSLLCPLWVIVAFVPLSLVMPEAPMQVCQTW